MTTATGSAPTVPVIDPSILPEPLPDVAPAPVASTDPDDIELSEALAAAQAEESATGTATVTDAATGAAPVVATPATPATPDPTTPAQAPVMIPKARLDEALVNRDRAVQDAAYWRGRAEAAVPATPPAQAATTPAKPTPAQALATIHSEIDALATRFDNGEITFADMKKAERALTDREHAIREEQLLAKATPAAPADGGNNELYLETLTAQLETQHPWCNVFEAVGTPSDWEFLKQRAVENLTARGVDPTQGTIGRYNLRKEIAELADVLGPALVGPRATAKGIALPGASLPPAATPAAGPAPLSQTAQQRAAKLAQAANAPPDLNAMTGAVGSAPGTFTDAQLEAMSDEEIGALPAATRNKLRGIV